MTPGTGTLVLRTRSLSSARCTRVSAQCRLQGELREDAKNQKQREPAPPSLAAPENHSAKSRRMKALKLGRFQKSAVKL